MGVLNSTVLDCVIGIVFVYLSLAILCTTINEWIAGVFAVRAKTLAKAIAQLLDQQKGSDATRSFLQDFYTHPVISGMRTPGKQGSASHPSYLPARTFATAVMDLVTPNKPGSITFADLESGVKNMPPGNVRTALLALLQNAKGDLDCAQKNIQQWFDDAMDRASGWYKRWTQVITICVAVLLTVATNADAVRIGRILWTNGTDRALLVERAKNVQASATAGSVAYLDKSNPLHPTFKMSKEDSDALKSVLGWPNEKLNGGKVWPSRLLGWILSIVAISVGAPFWFDALSKLMNLRNAGQKPEESSGKPGTQQAQQPATP
jgi:hypothetical protein